MKSIYFLCAARDIHATDWYKMAKETVSDCKIGVVTDLIEGEGCKKILSDEDNVVKLILISKLLFKSRSHFGDIWRNIVKFTLLPFQASLLNALYKRENKDAFFFANCMYYMLLAKFAHVPYVGTPQGSEVLIRMRNSKVYRWFAKKAIIGAKAITVDSVSMSDVIYEICGVKSHIIQNGINIKAIRPYMKLADEKKEYYLSIRGIAPVYQLDKLLLARNNSIHYNSLPLKFIYPLVDDEYKKRVLPLLRAQDDLIGSLPRTEMYSLLSKTKIAFSIPYSDSSPRGVYEAIFLGCVVIISPNKYYDTLPKCMKDRVVVADLSQKDWFDKANDEANLLLSKGCFSPSQDALDMFDQNKSFKLLFSLAFNEYTNN